MYKKLLIILIVALLGLASSAFANLVVNGDWSTGDETGWTRWSAPWGAGNWAVTNNGPTPPEGTASLNAGQTGSFGWFQRIPVTGPGPYYVYADWAGDIDGAGWAEVMFLAGTAGLSDEDVIARIDAGNAEDIAYKKDSWGMNPPTAWDWEPAHLSPHPSGNGGVITTPNPEITVALKLGSVSGAAVWCSWDNIVVVPEPATIALLGIGGLALLRKRR